MTDGNDRLWVDSRYNAQLNRQRKLTIKTLRDRTAIVDLAVEWSVSPLLPSNRMAVLV